MSSVPPALGSVPQNIRTRAVNAEAWRRKKDLARACQIVIEDSVCAVMSAHHREFRRKSGRCCSRRCELGHPGNRCPIAAWKWTQRAWRREAWRTGRTSRVLTRMNGCGAVCRTPKGWLGGMIKVSRKLHRDPDDVLSGGEQ
ncbi:hypothetical protein PUNSTDRAFT_110959 [Punctularia strigosozonata HHB-11173 SS5]|uniref:uncharacterized protein n=1 Tax=Punctularia strigosozonata (strain HHB-11173) TaxID=741275 RepID=UPI0004417676|nr:uncharacterized protein PUNSTDRAFT_110959 [Punctularia strigosozonata HHB-11173 SS5]EIN12491.1 hypothetical protein PUNSTDRAFT_110959 [Punctularia strigosozonata HHB-11173 SS5]